jgi:hypothetical protein
MIIPSYLLPRTELIPIRNQLELIRDTHYSDEFHIVVYFINEKQIRVIIRRIDSAGGWGMYLKLKIYDLDHRNFQEFYLGNSELNKLEKIIDTEIQCFPIEFKEQKIPKKIIQTYKNNYTTNHYHENAINIMLELNPEYEYLYFNDIDAREFIKTKFDYRVLLAYDTLRPFAFKADLFRYCVLYYYGGCYFDHKQTLKIPLRNFIDENDELILCKDRHPNTLYNAIMFSIPKHFVLKKLIEDIIHHCLEKHYYGKCPLYPTGPGLLGKYEHYANIKFEHINSEKIILRNQKLIILKTQWNNYSNDRDHQLSSENNYTLLWHSRQIYYHEHLKLDTNLILYSSNHLDRFEYKLINPNQLSIRRLDKNEGWGQYLVVQIINNYSNETKIIHIGSSHSNQKIIII